MTGLNMTMESADEALVIWKGDPTLTEEGIADHLRFELISQNTYSDAANKLIESKLDVDYGYPLDRDSLCDCIPVEGVKCGTNSCRHRSQYRECPANCGPSCVNNEIRQGRFKKILLEEIDGKGICVMAREEINEGERIMEYKGEVFTCADNPYRRDTIYAAEMNSYHDKTNVPDHELLCVDPTRRGNWSRFLSHSCLPSSYMQTFYVDGKKRNAITALRKIKVGEELHYHYGKKFENMGIPLCKCAATICKHRERYLKWLEEEGVKTTQTNYPHHSVISPVMLTPASAHPIVEARKGTAIKSTTTRRWYPSTSSTASTAKKKKTSIRLPPLQPVLLQPLPVSDSTQPSYAVSSDISLPPPLLGAPSKNKLDSPKNLQTQSEDPQPGTSDLESQERPMNLSRSSPRQEEPRDIKEDGKQQKQQQNRTLEMKSDVTRMAKTSVRNLKVAIKPKQTTKFVAPPSSTNGTESLVSSAITTRYRLSIIGNGGPIPPPTTPTALLKPKRGRPVERIGPFICNINRCKKEFAQFCHLTEHKQGVHGKGGKWECPEEGCGWKCNSKRYLNRHREQHKEKIKRVMYECPGCGERRTRPMGVLKHQISKKNDCQILKAIKVEPKRAATTEEEEDDDWEDEEAAESDE